MRRFFFVLLVAGAAAAGCASPQRDNGLALTESMLPEMPEAPTAKPVGSVPLGDLESFPEVQLGLEITPGPFEPSWESIEANYPGTPQWLRDAKFGIWVCFGPQAAGLSGDWYARWLYDENNKAYANHLARYGHPSEVGYLDVLNTWNPENLDPEYLTKIYEDAGARFLMIMGVHHDNFDLWDSKFQPWNSVNVGPHRDFLREWTDACHKYNMHFGVTFHHEYTWWWWHKAFGCDSRGEKAGVPYDAARLTAADGKGKWWDGLDPRRLYGYDMREYETVNGDRIVPRDGIFTDHLDYANWYAKQWALRMMDVVENYDPDFIYTDGTSEGPFCGTGTGAGYKCNAMPTVMADMYNRQILRRGQVDGFSIVKFRHPTNGTVTTEEFDFPEEIKLSQPWIRETPVGDWYYKPDISYDSRAVIRFLIEAISRDGNVAVNIPIRPDGGIDDACVTMLSEIGDWMKINGEAVYGSKAWKVLGEGETVDGKLKKLPGGALGKRLGDFPFTAQDIRFTEGPDGSIYLFTMSVPAPGQTLLVRSLAPDQTLLARSLAPAGTGVPASPSGPFAGLLDRDLTDVTLLGYDGPVTWSQTPAGLSLTYPSDAALSTAAVFRLR